MCPIAKKHTVGITLYLIAAYEINPKEKKVCIEERNISWLRVSFILTAIGLAFICMWFIFFHILFA